MHRWSDGRKGALSAQHPCYKGIIWEVTRCLSDLYTINPQGSGSTLRRGPALSTHLRGKTGLYAPQDHNYLRNRAQGFVIPHPSDPPSSRRSTGRHGSGVVYPGWCTGHGREGDVYPPGYPGYIGRRGIYPPWYPGYIGESSTYPPWYPGYIGRVVHTHHGTGYSTGCTPLIPTGIAQGVHLSYPRVYIGLTLLTHGCI